MSNCPNCKNLYACSHIIILDLQGEKMRTAVMVKDRSFFQLSLSTGLYVLNINI